MQPNTICLQSPSRRSMQSWSGPGSELLLTPQFSSRSCTGDLKSIWHGSLSLSGLSINRHLVADAELLILIDQYFLQILGGEEHLSEVLLQMDKRPLQPGAAVLSTSRDICISPLPPIWWQSEGGILSPLENGLKRLWYKGDELAESWLLLDQQRTAQLWMVSFSSKC